MMHDVESTLTSFIDYGCPDVTTVVADSSTGAVLAKDVVDAIQKSTVLVSILLAQNETGSS